MLKACLRHDVGEVVIVCGGEEIARHRRSYEAADFVFDPLHDLPLREQKDEPSRPIGPSGDGDTLDQAAPLQGWDLPPEFATLRRLPEARLSQKNRCAAGKRENVQVLRLMETFATGAVRAAMQDALRIGAISADAVRHLVLARIEGRPARLDADRYPHLPVADVGKTRPADYMALTGAP
jgi:hypothetical protein